MLRRAFAIVGTCMTGVTACDPCAGTFSCEQSPRIAIVGQLLDDVTGLPVPGARVEMRLDSGVAFVLPVATATTGSDGGFTLEAITEDIGSAIVTVSINSPGKTPYNIFGVRAQATVVSGDALVLRPWLAANPYLPYVIELYRDGTADDRIVNSQVEFRRTGGVRMFLNGSEVTSLTSGTDGAGWVWPFRGVTTDNAADLVGDLIVRLSPTDSAVFPQLRFPALPIFSPPTGLVRLAAAPAP